MASYPRECFGANVEAGEQIEQDQKCQGPAQLTVSGEQLRQRQFVAIRATPPGEEQPEHQQPDNASDETEQRWLACCLQQTRGHGEADLNARAAQPTAQATRQAFKYR